MIAKVGSSTVSYGIGVQNRYSAFLDDDDGLISTSVDVPANSLKRSNEAQLTNGGKQKGSINGTQKSKSGGRNEASNFNRKHDAQSKELTQPDGIQKQARGEPKRQQRNGKPPQQQSSSAKTTHTPRQGNSSNKPASSGLEVQSANNATQKLPRNQATGNYNHQQTASHQNEKENEASSGMKPHRGLSNNNNNQRFNRPRQFQNEDRKYVQQHDRQSNGLGPQFSEEDKQRRQQKRALDLKYKDPERREARRNQAANGPNEQSDGHNHFGNDDDSADQRGQLVRRDRPRIQDETTRNSKGPRPKGPRNQEGDLTGDRHDGQGLRRGDRPQRNRNGFGTGSRGSHGSKPDVKLQEKPKPIPNFSDKSDFPSLAS